MSDVVIIDVGIEGRRGRLEPEERSRVDAAIQGAEALADAAAEVEQARAAAVSAAENAAARVRDNLVVAVAEDREAMAALQQRIAGDRAAIDGMQQIIAEDRAAIAEDRQGVDESRTAVEESLLDWQTRWLGDRPAPPSGPQHDGAIYYDRTALAMYVWRGGKWNPIATGMTGVDILIALQGTDTSSIQRPRREMLCRMRLHFHGSENRFGLGWSYMASGAWAMVNDNLSLHGLKWGLAPEANDNGTPFHTITKSDGSPATSSPAFPRWKNVGATLSVGARLAGLNGGLTQMQIGTNTIPRSLWNISGNVLEGMWGRDANENPEPYFCPRFNNTSGVEVAGYSSNSKAHDTWLTYWEYRG